MKFGKIRRIHFVGIGGSGMSGIARVLLDLGYDVSGSDARDSSVVQRLAAAGARIAVGHAAANVVDADVVVRSTAVLDDNIEVIAAGAGHIPVIHRSEMLAELMRLKHGIAVGGAHGKTTMTSLIAHVLEQAQMDPTVIIGGRVKTLDDNAKLGQGEWLVAEADESDGSFLRLNPVISVLGNIDAEHLDFWGDFDGVRAGFVEFANRVPFWGTVVLGQDDANLADLRPQIRRPVLTFGLDRPADIEGRVLAVGPTAQTVRIRSFGKDVGELKLPLAGRHNVRNALAAIAVADALGIEVPVTLAALATFPGIERRFEVLCSEPQWVIDDYGHHPVELMATLAAAKERFDRPLWAIFQPHRYSRTAHQWDAFRAAMLTPDHVRLTDIYAAGEPPIEGIDSERLATEIHAAGHPDARHIPIDHLVESLRSEIPDGAVVLFMGAGNITQKARAYAESLA